MKEFIYKVVDWFVFNVLYIKSYLFGAKIKCDDCGNSNTILRMKAIHDVIEYSVFCKDCDRYIRYVVYKED